jgi:hypothetical protein
MSLDICSIHSTPRIQLLVLQLLLLVPELSVLEDMAADCIFAIPLGMLCMWSFLTCALSHFDLGTEHLHHK